MMCFGRRGMKQKVEGLIHVYPVKDIFRHETNMGAAGCYCEPTIQEVSVDHRQDNRVIRRVVIHQRLKGKEGEAKELQSMSA